MSPPWEATAFRQDLVDRYADGLYRWAWARTRGNPSMAEEIVQRSFLTAFERASAYDPARGEPWGWLLGLALNHLKTLRREGRGLSLPLEVVAPAAGGDEGEGLRLVLTTLPPDQQELLERHYLKGEPVERLASRLGLSPSTAWARLAGAREALKKALSHE